MQPPSPRGACDPSASEKGAVLLGLQTPAAPEHSVVRAGAVLSQGTVFLKDHCLHTQSCLLSDVRTWCDQQQLHGETVSRGVCSCHRKGISNHQGLGDGCSGSLECRPCKVETSSLVQWQTSWEMGLDCMGLSVWAGGNRLSKQWLDLHCCLARQARCAQPALLGSGLWPRVQCTQ